MRIKNSIGGILPFLIVILPFILISWLVISLIINRVAGEPSQIFMWLPTLCLAFLATYRLHYFAFGIGNFNLGKYAVEINKRITLQSILVALLIVASLIVSYFIYAIYLVALGVFIWMYFIGDHPWPVQLEILVFSTAAGVTAFAFWISMSLGLRLINRMNRH